MEKFKGKESALMSYILRKKIFMSENDAYQQKTQQLHQELICEFAKLYNIKMVAQRIIQYWVEHFNVILAQGMGIWMNQSSKVKMPRGVPKGGCWRFEMINTL